jgi:methyltransferase (TIGR00027 family)
MQTAQPSRTAMRVAIRRAAHQLLDAPRVLDDPLALRIIGTDAAAELKASLGRQQGRVARAIRAFMAVRSRCAEDELSRAIARGVTQYVVLGAGLDTFAYRNPHPESALKVFEVDYPATQMWKRERLAAAAIPIPSSVTFAPVDFERQTLPEGLALAGFDRRTPAFFSWLGVTMYLTEDAIAPTFEFIASTPRGGGLVFDYAVPRSSLSLVSRLALDVMSRRVAAAGEPFRTFFDPPELGARLARIGFRTIEDLGPDELNARYFHGRADRLRVSGHLGRVMSAQV